MSQPMSQFKETPQSIAGVTEDFEVFLLNKELKPIWSNNKLMDIFKEYIATYNISKAMNYKVVSDNKKVIVSAIAINNESNVLIFTASLNFNTGSILWD